MIDQCCYCEVRGDMKACVAYGAECPHHNSWYATALRAENARLRGALKTAIDAIRSTPVDTFGAACDTPTQTGWWIRDELVDRLCNALTGASDERDERDERGPN